MRNKLFVLISAFLLANAIISAEVSEPQALQRFLKLAKGHEEFRSLFFKEHEKEFVRLVKEGQSPKTLFIGCSDSRVVPEFILSMRPGDLFVIRTAGNFVPIFKPDIQDGVSATVQYAVEYLGVKDIIVCGHSHCGAIAALFIKLPPNLDIVARWLRFGEEAKKATLKGIPPNTPDEVRNAVAERVSVLFQLEHLLTFPFVKKKVEDKAIFLHGWHFTIDTGEIEYYDPMTYQFLPLSTVK